MFTLCREDYLISTLRDTFRANIVRVPEERIRPLQIVAYSKGKKTSLRGNLGAMLTPDSTFDPQNIAFLSSPMADVAGRSSRSVNLDVGLNILEGFLQGLSIPSAGISAQFKGVTEVSFSFQDVERIYIDINELGQKLDNQFLNRTNPASYIFFNDSDHACLVIDSVVVSSSFAISIEKTREHDYSLDVPAIQEMVADLNTDIQIKTTAGRDLVFEGEKKLAFAFSCVRMQLDEDGRIMALLPAKDESKMTLRGGSAGGRSSANQEMPDRLLLSDEPAMLDMELMENDLDY